MGNESAHWLKMKELLRAGPQLQETLVRAAMPLVPPGRATRQRAKAVVRQRLPRSEMTAPQYSHRTSWSPTDPRAIAVGQREIVMDVLSSAARVGRVNRWTDAEGNVWVQLAEQNS